MKVKGTAVRTGVLVSWPGVCVEEESKHGGLEHRDLQMGQNTLRVRNNNHNITERLELARQLKMANRSVALEGGLELARELHKATTIQQREDRRKGSDRLENNVHYVQISLRLRVWSGFTNWRGSSDEAEYKYTYIGQ